MRLGLFLTATLTALAATLAHADTSVGWYVAADVGYNQTSTQKLTVTEVTASSSDSESASSQTFAAAEVSEGTFEPETYSLKPEPGPAAFIRGGYRFNPHWRVEAELGVRRADIEESLVEGNAEEIEGGATGRGSFDQDSLMFNVLYDIAPENEVHPFVGLGVGAVQTKVDYTGTTPSETYTINESNTYVAYQAITGLTWAVNDRLNVDLTYRYMQVPDVSYDMTSSPGSGCEGCGSALAVQSLETSKLEGDYNNQTLTVGLRWTFAPPPAPVAPPPPAYSDMAPPPPQPANEWALPAPSPVVERPLESPEPKAFIVYFAFNESKLSDTAGQVVDQAAAFALSYDAPVVKVIGHTDTSGSTAYNAKLSERRARAVADGLVARGVDASKVQVDWAGESSPLQPTPDGVVNARNRRTTIDITF